MTGNDGLTRVALGKSEEMGRRFREARQRRGLSTQDCARLAGIDAETLQAIEVGAVSVDWGDYLAVLQIFGLVTELDGICSARRDVVAADAHPVEISQLFDEDL